MLGLVNERILISCLLPCFFFPLFSFLFFTAPTAGGECWWHVCLCLYDIGAIYGVDILKLHMSLACWVACLIENSLSSHL